MYKKYSLVFVLIILAVSLVACGGSDTTNSNNSGNDTTNSNNSGNDTTNSDDGDSDTITSDDPAPAEELSSITLTMPDDIAAFNGINVGGGYAQAMGELVMLSLAETDPNGNIFPELATEIPTIENGGVVFDEETWSMTVTWKLREDVFWSDGEQVTADDVIFTWDMVAAEAWTAAVDYTESVEKIDDFTFIVYYYEGYIFPDYALQFGGEDFFVYPEHYCDAEQGFFEWDCEKQPLSSGPYILEEWVADSHLTFVANPTYFEEGKPAIDQVIVQIVPDAGVVKAMMFEGDADLDYWPTLSTGLEYDEPGNGVNFLKAPTQRWVLRLFPNTTAKGDRETTHPFLADKLVRQALRMAVDVDTIIDDIYLGISEPVWTEFFRPPYNGCGIARPEYDPEGAKALLKEAGWEDTDGDGINECHGCANAEEGALMSMEFVIYAEAGELLGFAHQLIAENFAAIGVDTELLSIEGNVLWAPAEDGGTEESGNFDMDMWDDGYPGTDPSDFLWTYYYSGSIWNYGWWFNDDMDALIDEFYSLDEEYRLEVACDMAAILEEEVPQLMFFSLLESHGVSERIQGVQPSANDQVTWNIADWTLTE